MSRCGVRRCGYRRGVGELRVWFGVIKCGCGLGVVIGVVAK